MTESNPTCPACGVADGIPKAVTAGRGTLTVTLACGQCGHNWTTERKPVVQLFQRWGREPLQTP